MVIMVLTIWIGEGGASKVILNFKDIFFLSRSVNGSERERAREGERNWEREKEREGGSWGDKHPDREREGRPSRRRPFGVAPYPSGSITLGWTRVEGRERKGSHPPPTPFPAHETLCSRSSEDHEVTISLIPFYRFTAIEDRYSNAME